MTLLAWLGCTGEAPPPEPVCEPSPQVAEPAPLRAVPSGCDDVLVDGTPDPECDGTAAVALPIQEHRRLHIIGEAWSQAGNAVACGGPWAGGSGPAIAVGAWDPCDNDCGGDHPGRVGLFAGGTTGVVSLGGASWLLEATDVAEELGAHVAFGTDLVGGGAADLVVSAPDAGGEEYNNVGAVHLFSDPGCGRASPADATAVVYGTVPSASLGLGGEARDASGDGRPDLILAGDTESGAEVQVIVGLGLMSDFVPPPRSKLTIDLQLETVGLTVESADLTGDGVPDPAVVDKQWSQRRGRVLIAKGPLPAGTVDLETDAYAVLEGPVEEASVGVLEVADFSGDGYLDMIVGSWVYPDGSGGRPGRAYLFFGPLEPGNASLETADVIVEAESSGAFLGFGAESGDFDGDGVTDLALAATSDGYFRADRPGLIYLLRGPLGAEPIDLARDAIVFVDDHVASSLGYSMAACDLDGDGADELIVGSPLADFEGLQDAGRVQVIAGGTF